MTEIRSDNFGIVIAYLLPGFLVLWGISFFSPTVAGWFGGTRAPTVGGFAYVTLTSLGAGLIVSTIRWRILDTIHHGTGVRRPQWDFAELHRRFQVFERLVDNHYRYYQFYGNTLIAMIFAYAAYRSAVGRSRFDWEEVAFTVLALLLFAGSRDTMRKYYRRTEQLLRQEDNRRRSGRYS